MQASRYPSTFVFGLLLTIGTLSANLLFATASWGQTTEVSTSQGAERLESDVTTPGVATNTVSETANAPEAAIAASVDPQPIVVETAIPQLEELHTEQPSTTAGDLQAQPIAPAQPAVAVTEIGDLAQANDPGAVAQWSRSDLYNLDGNSFTFRVGGRMPVPTALQGATRPRTVLPGSNRSGGVSAIVRLERPIFGGEGALEIEGGANILAFDLGFISQPSNITTPRTGFGVNLFNQRSYFPAYREGDRDVDLPNQEEMWIHRLGGGAEVYVPLGDRFNSAIGLSYQRVSVRDDIFTDDVEPIDEFGNRLTVDSDGIDDLLTFNIAAVQDFRDSRIYPTTGSILRLGMDQGITLGDSSIAFNRLSANYTRFIPFSLFGFDEGPRTLVLNVQGGVIIGDTPSYEGFNLGGVNSVRGFDKGDIGTGSRFVQATVEYRFPIFSFNFRDEEIPVGGTLFVDYANDLDSGEDVIGEPGEVRDKPGDGLGFGVGLRVRSPFGPIRAELGFGVDGDTVFYLTTSERF
ncbi:BamA/TamA family outer membrane protein [Oscillatoria sp. FACHB-1407]|uniref:BamA/TamA family outer membrane protein n=1 Tax=Oscillatoria sp. FACHB-1407 TaxID=2692847 RepID=UPI001683E887|nr:BamA/TamA family outer membrane protein [Oscillatoria sp. FACHB-1407]MBD2465180.1 BamA/TamA family outer membrane protein [Oscillatoria sp. FACHB-1407]